MALVKADAKTLFDHALKSEAAPAHDTLLLPVRSGIDDPGEFGQLLGDLSIRVSQIIAYSGSVYFGNLGAKSLPHFRYLSLPEFLA